MPSKWRNIGISLNTTMNIKAFFVPLGLLFLLFILEADACAFPDGNHKPQAWCCAVEMDKNGFCKRYKKCDLDEWPLPLFDDCLHFFEIWLKLIGHTHWHLHEWSIGNFLQFEINSCVALTLTFESITFFGNGEQNCKFNIHVTFNPVLALLPLLGVLLAPDVGLEDGLVGAGHVAVIAEELLRLLVPHLLPVTLALRVHRIKIFQNAEKYLKI